MPFVIRRTDARSGTNVQDIRSGSRRVRPSLSHHQRTRRPGDQGQTFDDYQSRLLENFVILDRARARVEDPARARDVHARKLGGRVQRSRRRPFVAAAGSARPRRVSIRGGRARFPSEFLQLPEEVLTTTMIHHQHYFPVVDDEGKLKPAFLAVTNMQPEKPEIIARNSERVLTARLRDARFFYDEDRKAPLESRIERLVARSCFTRSSAATTRRPNASRRWRHGSRARRCKRPDGGACRSRPAVSARRTWPPTWSAS